MKEFLDKRIYIITFIFGLGGGVLSTLLDITEISNATLTSIAVIFAFLISLFISFLLRTRWTSKTKLRVTVISFCMLLISMFLAYNYFDQYNRLTFTYSEGFQVDSTPVAVYPPSLRHLKGCYYSETSINVQKQHKLTFKYKISDSALLFDYYGGLRGMEYVWDSASIECAKRTMFLSYSLFVLFLSATISLLAEVLYTKYKHKP